MITRGTIVQTKSGRRYVANAPTYPAVNEPGDVFPARVSCMSVTGRGPIRILALSGLTVVPVADQTDQDRDISARWSKGE